jgi:hypothetical protein
MIQEELELEFPPKIARMVKKLPIVFDWVEFKGETMFAGFNYDRSLEAGKPMFDMFYCATRALNHCALFTTQFDKNKFKPSRLGTEWQQFDHSVKP